MELRTLTVLLLVATGFYFLFIVTLLLPGLSTPTGRDGRCSAAAAPTGPDSVADLDWWQTTIVYQIYPRSMQDTNNDGVGDLNGITSRLGYLTELGVKTIWISPIFTSPMKDYGYDISNYKDIDPIFGTLADFTKLMKEAKQRGIRVVFDFVPNHTSDRHEWFTKSRNREGNYTDYYIWRDGVGPNKADPPNNWIGTFGGPAWTFDESRGQFYFHQYLAAQPDLNYRNHNVRAEMLGVLKFWLDLGVDGFRLDAIKRLFEDPQLRDEPRSNNPAAQPDTYHYLDHIYTSGYAETFDVLREWRKLLDDYWARDGKRRLMMSEVYGNLSETMLYFGNDSSPLADFSFNFQLLKLNRNSSGNDIYKLVSSWLDALPEGKWSNWVLGNHDSHRLANRTHFKLVDGFNMVNLLLGGTPVTYYGEEIGMVDVYIPYNETQDPKGKNRGPNDYWMRTRDFERTPMQWNSKPYAGFSSVRPWLRVGPNYATVNVETQRGDPNSHLNVYKSLVKLHFEPAILLGKVFFPVISRTIFSFAKVLEGHEGYVVVMNLAEDPATIDLINSNCCAAFSFPKTGEVVVQSGEVESPVYLHDVLLDSGESVVIKFKPVFNYSCSYDFLDF